MKKLEFLIRLIVISLIVWALVWSGVKAWQSYNFYSEGEYSGFPYKYWQKSCGQIKCEEGFNSTNLAIDIGIIFAASFIITIFSYRVKGRI